MKQIILGPRITNGNWSNWDLNTINDEDCDWDWDDKENGKSIITYCQFRGVLYHNLEVIINKYKEG